MTRDVYYQALFERLQAKVPGVVTWSRRHLAFSRLPAAAQPACLVLAANQDSRRLARGGPTEWTLGADVVLWVRATGQEESLDTVLNGFVDSIEAALKRDPGELHVGPFMEDDLHNTTLGGLVHELSIAGPVDLNQREGAEEASVVIPLDMVVLGDW